MIIKMDIMLCLQSSEEPNIGSELGFSLLFVEKWIYCIFNFLYLNLFFAGILSDKITEDGTILCFDLRAQITPRLLF